LLSGGSYDSLATVMIILAHSIPDILGPELALLVSLRPGALSQKKHVVGETVPRTCTPEVPVPSDDVHLESSTNLQGFH
jgi:hypothetical protein